MDAPFTEVPMEKTVSGGGNVVVVDVLVVDVVLVVVVVSTISGVVLVVGSVDSSPEQATNNKVAIDVHSSAWRPFIPRIVADSMVRVRHNRVVSLQTEIAASHLETLIERLTGVHKAVPDAEGDYSVHLRGATFMTRIDGDDQPICRIYAVISDGVEKTSELLEALNAINTRLTFLRIIWVRNQILMEGNHLALTMDESEFAAKCNDIANAANAFGDALVSDFGGTARFKASQDSGYLTVREGHGPVYL
jgi:hypothetical protein